MTIATADPIHHRAQCSKREPFETVGKMGDALLKLLMPAMEGHDIGLISEAGLPAVADPGSALVKAAHQAGIEVVPFSGPTSLLLALAASGLHGQSFAFTGYLPTEAAQRAPASGVIASRVCTTAGGASPAAS